jgi:hypothetical protein
VRVGLSYAAHACCLWRCLLGCTSTNSPKLAEPSVPFCCVARLEMSSHRGDFKERKSGEAEYAQEMGAACESHVLSDAEQSRC